VPDHLTLQFSEKLLRVHDVLRPSRVSQFSGFQPSASAFSTLRACGLRLSAFQLFS
jgi:hypothetical protein